MTRGAAGSSAETDGRRLRSERSREAIADALFELIGEGRPEPTAQEVAERAGMGIRTVFRLFSDMEGLYATLGARLIGEVMPTVRDAPPADTPLRDRASALVQERCALYERIAPYKRASNLKRPSSPFLTAQHRKLVRTLRERLSRWLPEIRGAPADVADALEQATSFEAWDRLRCDQGLSRPRARAAMERAVQALVGELGGAS